MTRSDLLTFVSIILLSCGITLLTWAITIQRQTITALSARLRSMESLLWPLAIEAGMKSKSISELSEDEFRRALERPIMPTSEVQDRFPLPQRMQARIHDKELPPMRLDDQKGCVP